MLTLCAQPQPKEIKLTLLETSDVHGNYLPYDFIKGKPGTGSLARVATYVDGLRQEMGREAVILLDNGDILQGQPTAYYYNFIDTTAVHLCAQMLNYIGYDAATVGNHDIETGHAVYDRWVGQCRFDMLGANATDTRTGKPYWKPYTLMERQGVRIAVLGMITPGIPQWLPANLWSDMRFDDLVETARKFMPEMREKADIVVGLLHSGAGKKQGVPPLAENAAIAVASQVPGFDLVLCGHDHRPANFKVANTAGDSVLVLNPAANAEAVARATLTLTLSGGKVTDKHIAGSIDPIGQLEPDAQLLARFDEESEKVKRFTNETIGYSEHDMETLPAFFGPSAFIDFIHQMQLELSGAEISFAAPLAFDARIPQGDIRVRDLFNLYRYENLLYVMELTGQEIKDYLEFSYAMWTRQMKCDSDPLLRLKPNADKLPDAWQRFENPSFNFDSAAGLRYTVDVTKPEGQKVIITALADGRPFSLSATYRCALNSYRGNGGGGLLTQGAGIEAGQLANRIVWATEKDLRYYLLTRIKQLRRIVPAPLNQWKFVPEDWVAKARQREELLLR